MHSRREHTTADALERLAAFRVRAPLSDARTLSITRDGDEARFAVRSNSPGASAPAPPALTLTPAEIDRLWVVLSATFPGDPLARVAALGSMLTERANTAGGEHEQTLGLVLTAVTHALSNDPRFAADLHRRAFDYLHRATGFSAGLGADALRGPARPVRVADELIAAAEAACARDGATLDAWIAKHHRAPERHPERPREIDRCWFVASPLVHEIISAYPLHCPRTDVYFPYGAVAELAGSLRRMRDEVHRPAAPDDPRALPGLEPTDVVRAALRACRIPARTIRALFHHLEQRAYREDKRPRPPSAPPRRRSPRPASSG